MFEIELFDESGEQLISKAFSLPSLPIVGQKIVLREKGEFSVTEVVIFIDEYTPSVPKYRIVVKTQEPASTLKDWSDMLKP